jgi:hypothetical protein
MGRLLPMKLPHHQDYEGRDTDLCERALLTIWPHLGDFQPNLSLVGGLVPRYLCRDPAMGCSRLQRGKQAAVTALALPSSVLRLAMQTFVHGSNRYTTA